MTLSRILELLKTIRIIQGGMGVNISSYILARIVSMLGQLGTISGVALEHILVLSLQAGDPDGQIRRVLRKFPFQDKVEEILDLYFIEEGKWKSSTIRPVPMYTVDPPDILKSLITCANFTFGRLAKEGPDGNDHNGIVSVNYLTKIEMPQIYAILGALFANIDVITMGAGIPMYIPPLIDALLEDRTAEYPITIDGNSGEKHIMTFNAEEFFGRKVSRYLTRPAFIPIISSHVLGEKLHKSFPNKVDGFVVEGETAGGHNAPPRGRIIIDSDDEPVYGDRDKVDFERVRAIGLPFWIGGGYGTKEGLAKARSLGATGVQVGGPYALCENSGMYSEYRIWLRRRCFLKQLRVRTSLTASPTGFPLKVDDVAGSMSDSFQYFCRKRVCDKGVLRKPYRKPDKSIGYRCPAEPEDAYVQKGGLREDTIDVRCICSGLCNTAGLHRPDRTLEDELPIFVLGNHVEQVAALMQNENSSYSAEDVTNSILQGDTA